MLFTGGQGCGKTTFLKYFIKFIPCEYALCVLDYNNELALQKEYPTRNVTAFSLNEMPIGEIKDKRVTIIGEIGKSLQSYYATHPCVVNTIFSLFTHHAMTTESLVEALSNDLLAAKKYKDYISAVSIVSNALNVDCHMEKIQGTRHIGRITEIIPTSERNAITPNSEKQVTYKVLVKRYPIIEDGHEKIDENGNAMGVFKLENLPSERMMEEIKSKLQLEEIAEFENDMKMLKIVSEKGEDDEEVRDWAQMKLLQAS